MGKFEKLKIGIIIGGILIIASIIGGILGLNASSAANKNAIAVAAKQAMEDAKKAADQKAISDKKDSDAKALADSKIRIAEILARQKITLAEIAVDVRTTLEAKAAKEAIAKANEIIYTNYVNSRYGFSIQYPNFLINNSNFNDLTDDKRSGCIFTSPDNLVSLNVEAWNNTSNDTLQTFLGRFREEDNISIPISDIFLKKNGEKWFEESYTIRGDIVYQYIIVGPGSINAVKFEYPSAQKEKFAPVVQKLFDSFKTPGIDILH